MSWSIGVTEVHPDLLSSKLHDERVKVLEQNRSSYVEGEEAEVDRQMSIAIRAASLLKSEVGRGALNASLYGHSNPDHVQKEGYSPDTITVTVTNSYKDV